MANNTTFYRENLVSLSFWQHVQLLPFFSPKKNYVLKANFQRNKSYHVNENQNFPDIQNVDTIGKSL